MTLKKKILVILLLFSVTALFPCSSANFQKKTPYIHGVTSDPSSFDPLGAYDPTSSIIISNVFEGLFAFDWKSADSNVIPVLAEDIGTWNTELTEWIIPLRDDVRWWDNSEFTAEDVVWNINRLNVLSESGQCDHSKLWFNNEQELIIASIIETEKFEVKLTLSKPWLEIKKLLAFWGSYFIKPIEEYEDQIVPLEDYEKLIGTGPFIIENYTARDSTSLKRFDEYHQGAANIHEIIFKIFSDDESMADALINEEIHSMKRLPSSKLSEVENHPNLDCKYIGGSCLYFIHMSDLVKYDIRKAMQFAFNYTDIVLGIFQGVGRQITHPIPKGMEGYNPDLPGLPYHDLSVARDYIINSEDVDIQAAVTANHLTDQSSTAEWRNAAEGEHPVGNYSYLSNGNGIYGYIANFAKDIGVSLFDDPPRDMTPYSISAIERLGDIDFCYGGWCFEVNDPVRMIESLFATNSSWNWNGLANATIDTNIAALHSLAGEPKVTKLEEIIRQVIVEQAHALYFLQNTELFAWNSDLITDGIQTFFNVRGYTSFYELTYVLSKPAILWIPGFPFALLFMILFGISALLVEICRKHIQP